METALPSPNLDAQKWIKSNKKLFPFFKMKT